MKDQFLNMMKFRHACKAFDENKKISVDDFQYILQNARLSPSSFGFEPWKFLVVQDPKLREQLKQHTWGAQGTLPTASHFIITLARTSSSMRFDSDYIQTLMANTHHIPEDARAIRTGYFETFQKHDFNLLQSDKTLFDWACKQTYIALANMMSAAAFIGIDSCPIEGFKEQEINQLLADKFAINTDDFQISHMLAFGYRKEPQKEKTRQSIEDIVTWY
jgi:nitroreductase